MAFEDRISEVRRRFQMLVERLADPAVYGDREAYRNVTREHSELAPVVELAEKIDRAQAQLAEARDMIEAGDDVEMVEMAEHESAELTSQIEKLEAELRTHLL